MFVLCMQRVTCHLQLLQHHETVGGAELAQGKGGWGRAKGGKRGVVIVGVIVIVGVVVIVIAMIITITTTSPASDTIFTIPRGKFDMRCSPACGGGVVVVVLVVLLI